jgi:hypothetical protein
MNTVLLILAFLSVGAVVIASYVFMAAARNYVSEGSSEGQVSDDFQLDGVNAPDYFVRSSQDRRQINNVIDFPITLTNGQVVFHERRLCERRSTG